MDHELVALYCAETKQPPRIVEPFIAAGVEPPHRDTTDRVGFSAAQVKLLHRSES